MLVCIMRSFYYNISVFRTAFCYFCDKFQNILLCCTARCMELSLGSIMKSEFTTRILAMVQYICSFFFTIKIIHLLRIRAPAWLETFFVTQNHCFPSTFQMESGQLLVENGFWVMPAREKVTIAGRNRC